MTDILQRGLTPRWPGTSASGGPLPWLLGGGAAAALAVFSTEPLLAFGCLITLLIGWQALWRRGEPPILFALFALQWLQISMAVFRVSLAGLTLTNDYRCEGVPAATWLSLAGLLVLALGIRLALGSARSDWPAFVEECRRINLRKSILAYVAAQLFVVALGAASTGYPGLKQIVLALGNLRWAFFFLVAVVVFVQRRGYAPLALMFAFELGLGFLSFFSEFKTVFLVLALAFMTARQTFNAKTVAVIGLLAVGVAVLGAAWSVVKEDYRGFLNRGTGRQEIAVDASDRAARIGNLLINEGFGQLSNGFQRLAERIEYVYYFGRVVDRVPSVLPYEYGAGWGAAIVHVLTPRLLFPEKAALSPDILKTQYYTGLLLTWDSNQDTEIPLGYMADSYIDFGPIGMFAPILLLGMLYGAEYRFVITRKRYRILTYGAAPVIFMPAAEYGWAPAKILGGNVTAFAAFCLIALVLVPRVTAWVQSTRRRLPAS